MTLYATQLRNSFRRGLFHPNDIKTMGLTPPSPGPKTAPLPSLGYASTRRTHSPSFAAVSPVSGPSSARPHAHPLEHSHSQPQSANHSRSSSFVGAAGGPVAATFSIGSGSGIGGGSVSVTTGSFGRSDARRLYSSPAFGKYAEDDEDEDYDDLFAKPLNGTSKSGFLFSKIVVSFVGCV